MVVVNLNPEVCVGCCRRTSKILVNDARFIREHTRDVLHLKMSSSIELINPKAESVRRAAALQVCFKIYYQAVF